MGSAVRAAGGGQENAQAARRRLRKEAAIVREAFILERYAAGDRIADIVTAVADRFGSCSRTHLYEVIPRALARLADRLAEHTADQARALYVERLEMLMAPHMPRALGLVRDDDGNALPPDLRAATFCLGVVEKIAEATGGKERPKRGDINVNVFNLPDNPDAARDKVLAELAKEREKIRTVEGHLVAVGGNLHALTDGEPEDDRMPPPVGARESEAA